MPASRCAVLLLFVIIFAPLASSDDNPLRFTGPHIDRVAIPPVLPNSIAFDITLRRMLSAPPGPRQFVLPPGDEPLTAFKKRPRNLSPKFTLPRVRVHYPPDDLCYTGRNYRYRRQSRDSDVTVPDGYTTCTAASRFEMKPADSPVRERRR